MRVIVQAARSTRRGRAALPPPETLRLVTPAVAAELPRPVTAPLPPAPVAAAPVDWAKRHQLLDAAGIPALNADADLRAVKAAYAFERGSECSYGDVVNNLLDLLERPGIVALFGTPGTGKTWMAAGLAREFCRNGRSALYLSDMAACAGRVRAAGWTGAYSAEQRLVAPSLLVLDEAFGKGVPGDFDADLLDRIVNRRHQRQRSTVLIANADEQLFAERVGGRIVDRIREGGIAMRLAWPSFRGRKMD